MKPLRTLAAAASALALLSACSGGGTNDQTAASNEAAPPDNMSAMAHDPNNPYGQSEMQMHERMMAAVGANASETWVRKMIEHHRGAVDMTNVLIGQGGDEPVLGKARKAVDDQGREIQLLERMLAGGGIGAGTSGNANPYTQSEQTMHSRMMVATGANPSETWIRKMIEHHRGAVDMSNILMAQGGDPKVLEMARITAQKQQKEIQELEDILTEGGAAAASSAQIPTAEPPVKAEPPEPAPAAKAKAETTRAAPKATPKAAPKESSKAEPAAAPKAPAAAPTCAPEHRAAGHC